MDKEIKTPQPSIRDTSVMSLELSSVGNFFLYYSTMKIGMLGMFLSSKLEARIDFNERKIIVDIYDKVLEILAAFCLPLATLIHNLGTIDDSVVGYNSLMVVIDNI